MQFYARRVTTAYMKVEITALGQWPDVRRIILTIGASGTSFAAGLDMLPSSRDDRQQHER